MRIEPIQRYMDHVELLDQRRLPDSEQWLSCRTGNEVIEAIQTLAVRGAPAIGIAGLYGLWLEARRLEAQPLQFTTLLQESADRIRNARPTAVNLAWGITQALDKVRDLSPQETTSTLRDLADTVKAEDLSNNRAMGQAGLTLFSGPVNILTHCNAGSLATAGYGTALGVIRALHQKHWIRRVWVDETRPLLQGARLTAWELEQDQIAATLITDSMAAHVMAHGEVDAVIVGADRIAHNGDTANKIGTYGLAVLARYHNLPFYVAAPLSTLDPKTLDGPHIPIEQRSAEEVRQIAGALIAPATVDVYNPAFDVTPSSLITGIITERGVIHAPYNNAMDEVMEKRVGR